MPRQPRDIAERFWEKVDKSGECWLWLAAKVLHANGYYGVFTHGSRTDGSRTHEGAHRVSYRLTYGEIPNGMHVHHKCETTLCVRPDHLELRDSKTHVFEHLSPPSANAKKTHCPKGHPLSGDNLRVEGKNDGRRCKICRLKNIRERYEKHRKTK